MAQVWDLASAAAQLLDEEEGTYDDDGDAG